jgi:hypothetical protein
LEAQASLTLWIGAGASKWAGYRSWDEVARFTHKAFVNRAVAYERDRGFQLLTDRRFPDLFELCSTTDRKLYLSVLTESLSRSKPNDAYVRFLKCIAEIPPVRLVTTNVDEELERGLGPGTTLIQNTDLERLSSLLNSSGGFIAKLHGSLSHIDSLVFTTSEYRRLLDQSAFPAAVRNLLYNTHVLFFGYGLADDYVLKLLQESDSAKPLFGDGPHFIVTPNVSTLPQSVRRIVYNPDAKEDHRSAIQVLDEIRLAKQRIASIALAKVPPTQRAPKSAHLLAEVFSPGTWQSSTTLQVSKKEDGSTREIVVGEGWSNEEIGTESSRSLHDLVVGLLCFDTVFAPLSALTRIWTLTGETFLGELVSSGALRLVYWPTTPSVIFPTNGLVGDLSVFHTLNPDGFEVTVSDLVRRNLRPVPGKERQAEARFAQIINSTLVVSDDHPLPLPDATRSALIRPSVKGLLGLSEGLPPGTVPRWSVFSVLRLAHLIQLARTCEREGIVSLHIQYGMPELVDPVFAVTTADLWAESAAQFVLSGRFDANLGSYVQANMSILGTILKFRDTEPGIRLRKEILERLANKSSGDIIAVINGGLGSVVPNAALQSARDQMTGLLTSISDSSNGFKPAIWNDQQYGTSWLDRWKRRSLGLLEETLSARGLTRDMPCPCGSGEAIKDCCRATLRARP